MADKRGDAEKRLEFERVAAELSASVINLRKHEANFKNFHDPSKHVFPLVTQKSITRVCLGRAHYPIEEINCNTFKTLALASKGLAIPVTPNRYVPVIFGIPFDTHHL
eukprot:CAMPEP_0184331286 /NCGR_PEP_ID=MMETSP1089-20130417/611_1 /TAXON_ID=38269 ORGANISM="Gloeochaete wittrockiana, Strain SAG46.84" /NCGR_SAMPLE_ID=MMETSP1089 /ASSEMBLY_ACC=CAM_ASM_000445 /LENGTH=107 /DNA_ID=CAMNT_0026654103 /DNA_START=24 /DNA_END=347 /DNA_ORIENTATION=+